MKGNVTEIIIFEMKYIKGMEFQAIFFIDIDMHSSSQPDLLDRYLYVGVSRASFYLAITLNEKLPERFEYLGSLFYKESW
jgi:DNA helicase IV